jgi:hypothetical protein
MDYASPKDQRIAARDDLANAIQAALAALCAIDDATNLLADGFGYAEPASGVCSEIDDLLGDMHKALDEVSTLAASAALHE